MICILQQHWEKMQQVAMHNLQSNLSPRANTDGQLFKSHKRAKERLQPQVQLPLTTSSTLERERTYTTYLRYLERHLESVLPQVLALPEIVRDLEVLNQQDHLVIGKD